MKVLCWSFSSVHLSELFSRELARIDQNIEMVLQINPEARTSDFTAVRCSSFVRAMPFSSQDLKREIGKVKPRILVMDLWSLIFSSQMDEFVAGLNSVLTQPDFVLEGLIIFGPSPILLDSAEFDLKLKQSIKHVFETIWNLSAGVKVRLVTSGPIWESFLGLMKIEEIVAVQKIGISLLPEVIQKKSANFVTLGFLSRSLANLTGGFQNAEKWSELKSDHCVEANSRPKAWKCSWKSYFNTLSKNEKTTHSNSSLDLSLSTGSDPKFVSEFVYRLAVEENVRSFHQGEPMDSEFKVFFGSEATQNLWQ